MWIVDIGTSKKALSSQTLRRQCCKKKASKITLELWDGIFSSSSESSPPLHIAQCTHPHISPLPPPRTQPVQGLLLKVKVNKHGEKANCSQILKKNLPRLSIFHQDMQTPEQIFPRSANTNRITRRVKWPHTSVSPPITVLGLVHFNSTNLISQIPTSHLYLLRARNLSCFSTTWMLGVQAYSGLLEILFILSFHYPNYPAHWES